MNVLKDRPLLSLLMFVPLYLQGKPHMAGWNANVYLSTHIIIIHNDFTAKYIKNHMDIVDFDTLFSQGPHQKCIVAAYVIPYHPIITSFEL